MTKKRSELVDEFVTIKFGYASAEREAQEPGLLDEGFVDGGTSTDAIFSDGRFLVLGQKGSGKSALGLHLEARAANSPSEFVMAVTVAELLGVAAGGKGPGADDAGLRWTLLLYFLSSVAADEAMRPLSPELGRAITLLEREGLLVPDKVPRGPRQRSTKTIRDPVTRAFEVMSQSIDEDVTAGVRGTLLIRRVVAAIAANQSDSWHVLVIDGFEQEIVARRDVRLRLAGLVRAAADLNRGFAQSGARLVVVVLCRTDIFDALPVPDKNKLRQDHAIQLRWHDSRGLADQAKLGRLVNIRASLSVGRPMSVADRFFGWRYRSRLAHRELLRFTRSTPRDVISLLNTVKEHVAIANALNGRVLSEALQRYTVEYLWLEIEDELEHYLTEGAPRASRDLLRRTGRSFELDDLRDTIILYHKGDLDPVQLLRGLYDAGAISQHIDGDDHFSYASPYPAVQLDGQFQLHPGVALAIIGPP